MWNIYTVTQSTDYFKGNNKFIVMFYSDATLSVSPLAYWRRVIQKSRNPDFIIMLVM